MTALESFHPAIAAWFRGAFETPTPPQAEAWPAIASARHALISAPTGSGKTLAAFLAALDELVRLGIAGELTDATRVVYVSPLKALSNDIERNLQQPLAGIRAALAARGDPAPEIRVLVRSGDTPQSERAAMSRRPPHILVTTPESLYLLLTSESGRAMLGGVRSVIVDEIHALAGNKRGAHLSLSLERLAALTGTAPTRIGLSATQKPIEEIARFLTGGAGCTIVDSGHRRRRDLALELPDAPLEAVMSGDVWEELYDRLAALIAAHRSTLVFVNTRRLAERVTRHLAERIGREAVTAHHGSLARAQRLDAEQRLKRGELRALVATASLELGIDIGDVDLVCQLGSPRAIATFLQRVGRANHAVAGVPKGRLFPLSRDELIECAALLDAVRRGELDRLRLPQAPLDVLAQQLVAELGAAEWEEDALFELVRRAYPYRALERADFDRLLACLADGYATRRGRRSAYLHRDAVHRRLRGRRGARLAALTCGGAIPDNADYQVRLEPEGIVVGTVNEDFAVESMAGDVFQLGNSSYRVRRIEPGLLRVEDAHGAPPNIPFWIGEAPGRSEELSAAVSRLRAAVDERLGDVSAEAITATTDWLAAEMTLPRHAAEQIVTHLAGARALLGVVPTQGELVLERFFDETGGMQLVIHSPYGSRINRAWGLALRKRFCRKFNFELQAAATEDAIVLSLGEAHSFPLEEVADYLRSSNVREVLTQAVLDAPLFTVRWRWAATISLALRRFRGGRRTPTPIQRIEAEDLLAAVFPDQIACLENLSGEREIPDHPLVAQTLHDCLEEAMDVDGLVRLLGALERGELALHARDLPRPSPLAHEILNARPYAFLDDAPLEERRTQAVMSRRWLDPQSAADFGRLDPEAIARVRAEAWPEAEGPDELHDALMLLGCVTEQEGRESGWSAHFERLLAHRRATLLRDPDGEARLWVAAESLPMLRAAFPRARTAPALVVPGEYAARDWTPDEAQLELLRARLQGLGPVSAVQLAEALGLPCAVAERALAALEAEGFALRGKFTDTDAAGAVEWCERRLLARIHRYTLARLRAEIEPVAASDFLRYLLEWQGVTREPRPEGGEALAALLEQLEGFAAPATAWEADILPARMAAYEPEWLDRLCRSGQLLWRRLSASPRAAGERPRAGPLRSTPIALLSRRHLGFWQAAAPAGAPEERAALSHRACAVAEHLERQGASFFDEIAAAARLLPTQTEQALGELAAAGLVSADSFAGLRALLRPADRRRNGRGRRRQVLPMAEAGRWSLIARGAPPPEQPEAEQAAWLLLRRYGVLFRRLIEREGAWLPPWYELLRVLRRLEARGELRGGRFVAGVPGEQYALPEAVAALRAMRRRSKDGALVCLSAADPLNLVGILTPGARLPALAGNRLLYRDGVPLAVHAGRETCFFETLEPAAEWQARNALLRRAR